MKTTLIVFAILILLGIVIFLLIRKPEKVIDDDAIIKPADADIDKNFIKSDAQDVDNGQVCLQESIDYTKEPEKVVEETEEKIVEETEEEVYIPEHCRIPKEPDEVLPNKYFFNIHKYTTAKNRIIYCVVCNAVINGKNYKVIVANSYYPYIGSYTKNLCAKIASKYTDNMTVEEFLKTGSTKFDRVGVIIDSLPYIF